MSGKSVFFTEGGTGISAGAPFTPFHYTIVTGNAPPMIADGRLAQLADAVQSIIAPGTAGVDTFVLGQGAQAFLGADRAVLIGKNVKTNNGGALQAADDILIGNNIVVPAAAVNSASLIVIGSATIFTPVGVFNGYGATVAIGAAITLANTAFSQVNNSVCIGDNSTVTGGANVAVGQGATVSSDESTAVGQGARASDGGSAFGRQANATGSDRNLALGRLADARGTRAVACGGQSVANNDGSNAFGWGAVATAAGAIAIGRSSQSTVANVCVIGNDATYPIIGVSIGVLPGLSGILRLPNATVIVARDATNAGDIGIATVTAGNLVSFGNANWSIDVYNTASFYPTVDNSRDIGVTGTNRVRNFFLAGQIHQDGADGAAAGTALLTNAPTSNTVQYVPLTFNGAAGWVPWIPA